MSSFAGLAAVEDRHFWFRARSAVAGAALRRLAAGLPEPCRVLEVGCGTGHMLHTLRQAFPSATLIGTDLYTEGLEFARRRADAYLVQGDAHALPFRAGFHLACLFDVLEHLPDDAGALREMNALLVPGGALLITVPAHPSLWSAADEAAHHCRRYTPGDLRERLAGAGLHVDTLTPFMSGILPLVWLWRRAAYRRRSHTEEEGARLRQRSGVEVRVVPVLNEALALGLGLEARFVARGWQLPFGASLLAVARKARQ